MKRIALLCAMLFTIYTAFAQKPIKGKVFDKTTNAPLSGATVTFAGKGGTTTDKNGEFTVDCSKTHRITISFVGYEPYSIDIKNCQDVNIALTSNSQYMDNVEIAAISGQNKSIIYQPAAISKLSPLELKRGQGVFLDDAIQTSVPGVLMNRRSVSGGQQFNIRGYGNGSRGTRGVSSNFDGQGYKVYLNNIPVTDAEGITTLDDIDYGALGNVEIIKGPAGTLYGQAISGVVNLKIMTPERGKTSLTQQTMFGNYGLRRYTTIFQAGTERGGFLLSYGKQNSDGFSVHNASHKDFVNFVGDFKPNEKQTVSFFIGYTDSYDQRLGELTIAQWNSKDYSGNIEYIKRNAHSHVSTFRAGLAHTYNFNKTISNTTSLFGTGFRSDASSAGGWTDKLAVNYGFRTSFETRFKMGARSTITGVTGVEVQRQDAQSFGYAMKKNPTDTASVWVMGRPYWIVDTANSNNAFVTTPTSYFTEWTMALPEDITISAGIGVSRQSIILDDRFNSRLVTATRPVHFDTVYKRMVSPHLAINKVFNKNISVYASYSVGYKAPVSSYFFITTPQIGSSPNPAALPTGRVNGVLKPEKGSQFEIGSKGTIINDRLVYQLALFALTFSDKMTAVAVPVPATPPTATAYSYMVNGAKQDHKGLELSLKYAVVKNSKAFNNITPFVNVAFSDFKYGDNFILKSGTNASNTTANNIDTLNYSGLNVFGTPKVTAAFGIDLMMNNGVYFNISDVYRDGVNIGFERLTQNPETWALRTASSYSLLNGKIGFRRSITNHWEIDAFFGVNNINGARYPIMIFVNQIPDAYIPAPTNAVVYGGLNLKFNFK